MRLNFIPHIWWGRESWRVQMLLFAQRRFHIFRSEFLLRHSMTRLSVEELPIDHLEKQDRTWSFRHKDGEDSGSFQSASPSALSMASANSGRQSG